jgi:hypothetical protein
MFLPFLLSIGAIADYVSAAAFLPRQVVPSTPGVVSAPVWRRDQTRCVESDIRRRDRLSKRQSNVVPVDLYNTAFRLLYFANSLFPFARANGSNNWDSSAAFGIADRYWVQRHLGRGPYVTTLSIGWESMCADRDV